jgi:ribosomal protein L25 (general stress protein Ctc)
MANANHPVKFSRVSTNIYPAGTEEVHAGVIDKATGTTVIAIDVNGAQFVFCGTAVQMHAFASKIMAEADRAWADWDGEPF